jgi:uncharacterized protein
VPEDVAQNASMLLAFRATNVRSFRDDMELSMLATSRAEQCFVREVNWRESGHPLKVLPVAGVFGANASGKSNVLDAIADMRTNVVDSFRQGPAGALSRSPFLLDSVAKQRPSRYEIDLVLNGVRHEYGFLLDDERVLEEWALRYPRGRAAVLFSRSGDRIEAGSAERATTRAVEKLLRPNALFLSTAAAANHPLLLPLHDWFRRNLLLADADNRPPRQAATVNMLDSDVARGRILALLRAADLGITGAQMRELDPTMKDRVRRAARVLVGEEGKPDGGDLDEMLSIDGFGFSLTHRGVGEEIELQPSEESVGTLVWLGLVGPVIDALADGVVLLADELDASLHPALVARLVGLFQDPRTNPHRAQLIFNSHDPTILGDSGEDRLMGRDQIWFTEKLEDGSTRLYPLTDLDPRKHEAVGRRYLAGRYGAVPILSRQEFDRVGELIASKD